MESSTSSTHEAGTWALARPAPAGPRGTWHAILAWTRDHGLSALSLAILVLVAVAGWSASFIGLHIFAVTRMGLDDQQAWLVPSTIDGAACGLTLMVFRAAIHGRAAPSYRLLIVFFTALSSWINWSHIDDHVGGRVAAVLCPSAVVLLEALTKEMRHSWEERNGICRPGVHPLRWVLAPWETFKIMKMWVLSLPVPSPTPRMADSSTRPEQTHLPSPADLVGAARASSSDSPPEPDDTGRSSPEQPRSRSGKRGRVESRSARAGDGHAPGSGRGGSAGEEAETAPTPTWPEGEEQLWRRMVEELGENEHVLADAVRIVNELTEGNPRVPGRDKLREELIALGHAVGSGRVREMQKAIERGREELASAGDRDDSGLAGAHGHECTGFEVPSGAALTVAPNDPIAREPDSEAA